MKNNIFEFLVVVSLALLLASGCSPPQETVQLMTFISQTDFEAINSYPGEGRYFIQQIFEGGDCFWLYDGFAGKSQYHHAELQHFKDGWWRAADDITLSSVGDPSPSGQESNQGHWANRVIWTRGRFLPDTRYRLNLVLGESSNGPIIGEKVYIFTTPSAIPE